MGSRTVCGVSITELSGWRAPGADGPHPVTVAVGSVRDVLEGLAGQPLYGMRDAELLDATGELERAAAQVAELKLRLVTEIGMRRIVHRRGAVSPAAWLRSRLRYDPGHAVAEVELGKELAGTFTATREALGAGAINVDHAKAIVAGVNDLPTAAQSPSIRAEAELKLLEVAATHNPRVVRAAARTVLEDIDPDLYHEELGKKLADDEERAMRRRDFSWTRLGDGRTRVRGELTEDVAQKLAAALDPLSAPLPANPDEPDLRTAGQRRHDGLDELLTRWLSSTDAPSNGGNGTEVVVTVTDTDLWAEHGYGFYLRDGTPVSAEQIRRDMCDGKLTVAWFDESADGFWMSPSPERYFTGRKRRALELRDQGCAFPKCDRPPRWCDGHHIRPWRLGGPTVVGNGVLLCRVHHRLVEAGEWTVRMGSDQQPEFLPPDFIDPDRKPQRNTMHHR